MDIDAASQLIAPRLDRCAEIRTKEKVRGLRIFSTYSLMNAEMKG